LIALVFHESTSLFDFAKARVTFYSKRKFLED